MAKEKEFLKFGQVVEKSLDFVLCLFGFVKGKKFRDSSEYSDCVPLSNFVQRAKKILESAKRPRYEFGTTVLHRTCKQRFSLLA